MTRADIVAEARSWIGTPHVWQASAKGVGCDCKGLVWGVARELDLPEAASVHARICDYGRAVPVDKLLAGLAETMDRRMKPEPGDVLLLRIGQKPQHLAILTDEAHMVHTYANGPERVIEVAMGKIWWRALHSAWRFRSVGE